MKNQTNFKTQKTLLALSLILFCLPGFGQWRGQTIGICEDGSEWPPYTHFKREGGKPTKIIDGYAVEAIQSILGKNGVKTKVDLIPWARCLEDLKVPSNYVMALNASYSAQREKDYLMSNPFYFANSYYFYSNEAHPNGLEIKGISDLKKYKVCGINGYNYSTYDLVTEKMEIGSKDHESMILKLLANRCDLFIEKLEILVGFGFVGKDLLANPALGRKPIPGVPPTPFHIIINKSASDAGELLKIVNKGLKDFLNSPKDLELKKKYNLK